MDVWFLTIVHNGHVALTSIMAESASDAGKQAYGEFGRVFDNVIAWNMTNCYKDISLDVIAWHNKDDDIKASLIRA